jgi:hypothetical protein
MFDYCVRGLCLDRSLCLCCSGYFVVAVAAGDDDDVVAVVVVCDGKSNLSRS